MPSHRALVTGSSRGIGAATARLLAARGHRVVINGRSHAEQAERVAREIGEAGGAAQVACFDVADPDAVREAYARLDVAGDPFAVVVNNAARISDAPFIGMTEQAYHGVLEVVLSGFFNVTQPLIMPMMRARFGRIVNVVSLAGILGSAGQVNYSAAKAGLIGATKSLARELASRRITVNAVCPGLIDTDMLEGLPLAAWKARIPLGRLGGPEEVAQAIGFLVGEESGYVTGHVLHVDGGLGA